MALMERTDDQLLDVLVNQRECGFRFDLLDQHLNDQGEIDVDASGSVTIDNDSDRAIKRQMSGVEISAADVAEVNPLRNRVKVSQVLSNGSKLSLGVFMFSGFDRRRYSWGRVPTPQFTDQSVILDQPSDRTISAVPGRPITDFLVEHLDPFELQYVIEENDATVSGTTAMGWPVGTSLLEVLNQAAAMAGFLSAYFDNDGVLHYRAATGITDEDHTYDLGTSSRVLDSSIVESDSWLDAPNRYVVIDATNTTDPVVGIYDIPAAAPNSAVNLGYVRAERIDAQGAGTPAACVKIGKARYQQSRVYEWTTFASPPDGRHDTFEVVRFDGVGQRETGWRMELSEGSAMEHELRRTYA